MLLVSQIQENKEQITASLEKRGLEDPKGTLDRVLALDQERRETQFSLDNIKAESNRLSKEIGQLFKAGKREEAEAAKAKTAEFKEQIKLLSEKLQNAEQGLQDLLYTIPNRLHDSVPGGKNEEDNEEIRRHGELPEMGQDAAPHWDLVKQYDIIDFDLGSKITGAGFPVYKGKGARLQRALVNFFLDQAIEAGYFEVQPPHVVNEASGYGTGQLPDKEGQMYELAGEGLYLIPTAEVPITNMYRDVIVNEKDLPIKNVGYTPCFRREAGSWGAHVRGLNRLHQFDKVEIVQVRKPEESYQALEEMCGHVEGLLQKLNLPYRVLRLCAGDIGFTSALTFDMEVYSGAQNRWLEVSSVSNFEAYQANRLKLRHRVGDKQTELLHTLNGSALALPRIMAAILENNQTPDGIKIPEALVPYTRFDIIN